MTRRSRVMSLWNYFDLPSHELSCDISFLKNHFFRNFISIFYIRSWTICNFCLKTKLFKVIELGEARIAMKLLIFLTSELFSINCYHPTSFIKEFLEMCSYLVLVPDVSLLKIISQNLCSKYQHKRTLCLGPTVCAPIHREFDKNISSTALFI